MDLNPFVAWIVDEFLPSVKVGAGLGYYARRVGTPQLALYGSADAACILYSIGRLPAGQAARDKWLATLQQFQDPGSGFFIAQTASLSKAHNTGFSTAAMQLFEADLRNGDLPASPLDFAVNFNTPERMYRYVRSLNWTTNVYEGGENTIGLASTFFNVAGVVSDDWFEWLLDFFDTELFDSRNGMVGLEKPPSGDLDQIGGTFHFDFFWKFFGQYLPHARKRADAILGLQLHSGNWAGSNPWWLTFDAIYMLVRVNAELPEYRADEIHEAIGRAVRFVYRRVTDPSQRELDFAEPVLGVHTLTGAISLFAAAQQFLGAGVVVTDEPLRLVLDRRPYIGWVGQQSVCWQADLVTLAGWIQCFDEVNQSAMG